MSAAVIAFPARKPAPPSDDGRDLQPLWAALRASVAVLEREGITEEQHKAALTQEELG